MLNGCSGKFVIGRHGELEDDQKHAAAGLRREALI